MAELGELLELLHGAGRRWTSVRLVLRQWGDSEVSGRAMQRAADQHRSQGVAVIETRSSRSGEPRWEMVTRAWIDRTAESSRSESTGPHGELLTVRRGPQWWSYTPHSGSMSNESEPEVQGGGTEQFDVLLDPSPLLAAFDFSLRGRTEVAGRPALEVVALPRPADFRFGFGPHLGYGADDVVLAVDQERGVVLRSEARLDGRPFAVYEVIEVAFDESFGDDVFRFVSPDGSPVRPPRETFGPPQPVSIEEAARRASFTVVAPTRLPQGWRVEASYVPASDRPRRPESVSLQVGAERMEPRVGIHQSAEPLPDDLDWDEIEHDGRRIRFLQRTGPGDPYEAKIEVHGAHVRASGNVEQDAFIDIVASLAPAPRALPPIIER